MTDSLDSRIAAAFSDPIDPRAVASVIDHMRFSMGMTYNECAARVAAVAPGANFEASAQEADDLDSEI